MEEQILKQLAQPLLAWYDIHRRILPWREEVSPYRTWVSEIMLQQTRVAAVLPYFQRFMEAFPTVEAMSQERPGAYNQALMDLGATVCLPSGAPLCGDCPAGDFCIARQEGCQARLPVRSPKREKRTEHLTVFLLRRGTAAALRQRPDTGLLAGLWEYPHVPGALTEAEAARQLQMWGVSPTKWTKKLSARHIFTHVRWEMTGYVVEVDGLGPGDWLWAEAQQRERLAIPSAFEKFTAELKEGE